jgi:hypothetical protein
MERMEEEEFPREGGLLEYTVSLMRMHLCQAIDMYFVAAAPQADWRVRSNSALSSVLHAYCAFETSVNEIGHLMFFHAPSKIYVPPGKRDYPLRKMIAGWDKIGCLDKFILIVELQRGRRPLPHQEAELRELNTLRNWIVHGFVFQATLLLSPNERGTFDQVDREDSVKWESKFPHLKFNRFDELDHLDARKAIVTVIDGLLETHHALGIPLFVYSLHDQCTFSAASQSTNADELFEKHLATKQGHRAEGYAEPKR